MNRLKVLHICSASIDSGAFKGALALHESMQNSDRLSLGFLVKYVLQTRKEKYIAILKITKKRIYI